MAHDHTHEDHDHQHSHGGLGHSHAPSSFSKAFAIGILLNTGFVLIEAGYGWVSNSMALIADAGHNLSDVLGLIVAWVATSLVKRAPTKRFTYGLRGSSILAALFNAMFLLVAIGAIAWEAVQRFWSPAPVAGTTVMVVAGIGILINGITAWLLASGQKDDLNIKGAFLHMAADTAVSAGVVVAGLVILYTGWWLLDPVVSLAIVAVIFWSSWSLLRDSVLLSLDAVPPGVDADGVRTFLTERSGVHAIHDLHIWAMSTTDTALTCHLVMPAGHPGDKFLQDTAEELQAHYGIGHVTLQIEVNPHEACRLAPAEVV